MNEPEASQPPRPPEVAVEVAGTPDEVWSLIATGPGLSTWFMPATVDPRPGGTIEQRHGSGDDDVSRGTIRAYEPPHRFLYEERMPGGATMATEFLVEAKSGGSCVVRVVTYGLSADDADFAGGLVSGWTHALGVLRVYLDGFAGRPAGSSRAWVRLNGTLDEAWAAARHRAGLEGAEPGRPVAAADGAPPYAGVVEVVQEQGVLLRTSHPAPGTLGFIATDFGGRVSVVVDVYVYAEDGAQAAADAQRRAWEGHLAQR